MRYICAVFLVVAMLIGVSLQAAAGSQAQLDSVLGVPWGASPEQARQIMAKDVYSFVWEGTDASTGSQVLEFKGSYAGMPAYISIYFMHRQMWQLSARISDKEYNMDYAFETLYKLLTEKYGPVSISRSYNIYKNIPTTRHEWNLDGNAKQILLIKFATFYIDKTKMDGGARVTYINIQLYETLKKSNI